MLRFTGERGRRLQRGERGTKAAGSVRICSQGKETSPTQTATKSQPRSNPLLPLSSGTMHAPGMRQRDAGRETRVHGSLECGGGRATGDRLKSLPAPSLSPLCTAPRITTPDDGAEGARRFRFTNSITTWDCPALPDSLERIIVYGSDFQQILTFQRAVSELAKGKSFCYFLNHPELLELKCHSVNSQRNVPIKLLIFIYYASA